MADITRESSAEELTLWLTERVAFYLDTPAEKIDRGAELAGYGMDSICSMAILTEIEDNLDLKVDTMLLWQYPTINDLVGYLQTLIAEPELLGDIG
ncbi:acyl carrier protein [Streptomyces sp. CG1]|uniref:acyl carrier protein n=1 Tax=Streptomyces sp. CG1 TaxID=1287523 RepID=UPI0034E22F98